MRIISKYKDYYDYYQGLFGMDNTKVYTRKDVIQLKDVFEGIMNPPTEATPLIFAITGIKYTIQLYRGKLYHTPDELEKLDALIIKHHGRKRHWRWHDTWENIPKNTTKWQHRYNKSNNKPIDINYKQREPVLMKVRDTSISTWEVPLLSTFNFHKVLEAKDIYVKIETFLGWLVDNPPLPDDQTNTGKIVAHGFDTKRSFRPNMKK